jgi:hypothetical protein
LRRILPALGLAGLLALGPALPARAVQLRFVVDEPLLVQAICQKVPLESARPAHREAFRAAKSRAWGLSEDAYNLFWDGKLPDLGGAAAARALPAKARGFVDALRRTPEFAAVRAQTRQRRLACEAQWKADGARAEAFVRTITGISTRAAYEVYVFHPAMGEGSNRGQRRIFWGGREDWPHYTTVYMWHEILHDHLPKDDLGHVLVQLATDQALRCHLDPGADRTAYVGHADLATLQDAVQPHWKRYLARRDRSILALYRELAHLDLPGRR